MPAQPRGCGATSGDIVGFPVGSLGVEPGKEIEFLVDSGVAVIGSPDEVTESIERLHESSGGFGTLLVSGIDWASRKNARRNFELLARFVAPRFNGSLRSPDASRE